MLKINRMTERIVKIALALLFFLCLLDMPYGFYELVRFIAMIGFGILSFKSYERQNRSLSIAYLILAIVFQPLLKISFGRQIWNIIDVIVALLLLISLFVTPRPRASK